MALEFGLIASGLFPTSEATGDGIGANVNVKEFKDAGDRKSVV